MTSLFVMAGGGTGGHVIPAIAVAREIVRAGHEVLFVGTERGVEARLVPAAGFRLEKIRVGGIKNLGLADAAVQPVAADGGNRWAVARLRANGSRPRSSAWAAMWRVRRCWRR